MFEYPGNVKVLPSNCMRVSEAATSPIVKYEAQCSAAISRAAAFPAASRCCSGGKVDTPQGGSAASTVARSCHPVVAAIEL